MKTDEVLGTLTDSIIIQVKEAAHNVPNVWLPAEWFTHPHVPLHSLDPP